MDVFKKLNDQPTDSSERTETQAKDSTYISQKIRENLFKNLLKKKEEKEIEYIQIPLNKDFYSLFAYRLV